MAEPRRRASTIGGKHHWVKHRWRDDGWRWQDDVWQCSVHGSAESARGWMQSPSRYHGPPPAAESAHATAESAHPPERVHSRRTTDVYAIPAIFSEAEYKFHFNCTPRMNDRDIGEVRGELKANLARAEEKHRKAVASPTGWSATGSIHTAERGVIEAIVAMAYLERFGVLHDKDGNRILLDPGEFNDNHDRRFDEMMASPQYKALKAWEARYGSYAADTGATGTHEAIREGDGTAGSAPAVSYRGRVTSNNTGRSKGVATTAEADESAGSAHERGP